MIPARLPRQRPADAKLLVIDAQGRVHHAARAAMPAFIAPGDVVIANDAATLPASLHGRHERSGADVEVRLAGRRSLRATDVRDFDAVVFGGGDYRTPTEHRPLAPPLRPGDRLLLGPLEARITRLVGHPRLVAIAFDGTPADIWQGLARHGRPIQYAHLAMPLALWDVWTPFAALPVAFEPPSAGFMLSWKMLSEIRASGAIFATLTHAAGISSTGDTELDRRLPFDEPYSIPRSTAAMVRGARERGGRVIAIGTTVVRALEDAANDDGTVRAGAGIATRRVGHRTRLRVVDAVVSGVHERGTSHYELLRALVDDATLDKATRELEWHGYRTHEFGDSVLIERRAIRRSQVRALVGEPSSLTSSDSAH